MANESKQSYVQNIILENREKISISGVLDILTFDEEEILLETEDGMLSIKGSDIKVEKLSIDTGEVLAKGNIDSMVYKDEAVRKGGFFKNMFK